MKRSTCYLLLTLSTIGWLGGVAKMSWIYQELRKEAQDRADLNLQEMSMSIPQYYRFN